MVWLRVSAAKSVEVVVDLVSSRRPVCEGGNLNHGDGVLDGHPYRRFDKYAVYLVCRQREGNRPRSVYSKEVKGRPREDSREDDSMGTY